MRLHPFCTLNKAIRRFTWEFWKKLVWCKFWRSWEQNAEKGSFIDMDVYNKYTIYEVYKLFFKKKDVAILSGSNFLLQQRWCSFDFFC